MKTLKITKTPKGKIKITDANEFSVCLMSSNIQKKNEDMAKLFAAAPELLEALKSAYECSGQHNCLTKPVLDNIFNAIKKAE